MKVLYFGHYKEGTGWSNVAINHILALDSVGVDVVCRNISLTGADKNVPDKIYELEKKSIDGCDYCIQHVLPHHVVGSQLFKKNVAYIELESIFTKKNLWHRYLDFVDEVWVPNDDQNENTSKFTKSKIKTIPHAMDVKYLEQISNSQNKQKDKFIFYTIADLNSRKNIESIIRCYYHSFGSRDNVGLLLKVKKFGLQPQQLERGIEQICQTIQKEMRMRQPHEYPEIVIHSQEATMKEIMNIHQECNCYVGVSRGEAWSIPSFEAMALGNTPICSKEGGPKMFIDPNNKNTGTLIDGCYSICNHPDSAFDHIFTGSEFWFNASELQTCEAMRYYYNNWNQEKNNDGILQAKKFNYDKIGTLMKESLYE